MARNARRRDQHRIEADVADAVVGMLASQASAAATMRPRWRSVTDSGRIVERSRAP